MEFPNVVQLAIPFFIITIVIELLATRFGHRRLSYETRDTAASLAMGAGNVVVGTLFGPLTVALFAAVHEVALFDIGYGAWAFLACWLAEDFCYYWFHRLSHERRWFWASHVIHHSSQHYNLSTALRQTWTSKLTFGYLFWLPLVFIGFEPAMVALFSGLNLIYQFWIHTEAIDRLGPLEWVFNTPSHHRVHHATNPRYLDANYAGTLIVWDRMFGTFVGEEADDRPHYGIIKNLATFNPLRIAFHEWVAMGRDVLRAGSWRDRLAFLFGPPGWSPDGSRQTSAMIQAAWRARLGTTGEPSHRRVAEEA